MIKLPKRTQMRITKTKFVPLQSTFVTEDGPAIGTIWFDRDMPNRRPLTVCGIERPSTGAGIVWFELLEARHRQLLAQFMSHVKEGRYVLIGVKPPAISHVETGRP